MSGYGRLPAHLYDVAERHRARDPDLHHRYTAPADAGDMPGVHEAIQTRLASASPHRAQ
jgi:hypothetical protein